MSSLKSDKYLRHRVTSTDVLDILMSHLTASWSVLTVNRLPYRYGISNRIAHTTASQSSLVGASLHSESLNVCYQYPIGLSVPVCPVMLCLDHYASHLLIKSVGVDGVLPFARSRKSISGFVSSFMRALTNFNSALARVENVFRSS